MEKKSISDNIIDIWKKTGKVSIIKSSGRCMIPLFDDGANLIVKHIQPDEIRRGDIAVFRSGDRIIAHRIIGKFQEGERCYFLEKRDSGFEPGKIPEDAIIGKVIGIKRRNDSINLEKDIWRLTNRLIGQYWAFFHTLYKAMKKLKKVVFKERKIPLVSKAYTLCSSFLINTANLFISLIHRVCFPKDKP